MGIWRENPVLIPHNIASTRKNHVFGHGIYYKGIWREMVLKEKNEFETWAMSVKRTFVL
jgi:hypothetical protein